MQLLSFTYIINPTVNTEKFLQNLSQLNPTSKTFILTSENFNSLTMKTQTQTPKQDSVSKRIKQDLKALFPKTKFSVRHRVFSGGDSVDVSYNDFLPESIIRSAICKYESGKFDGMTDCYQYHEDIKEVTPQGNIIDMPRTKFLGVYRTVSKDIDTAAEQYIRAHYAEAATAHEMEVYSAVRTLISEMDLTNGFDETFANNFPHGLFR